MRAPAVCDRRRTSILPWTRFGREEDQAGIMMQGRFALIGAAALVAAVVMAILGLSAGVGADNAIPAGPAATPTAITINASSTEIRNNISLPHGFWGVAVGAGVAVNHGVLVGLGVLVGASVMVGLGVGKNGSNCLRVATPLAGPGRSMDGQAGWPGGS